ncbi:MAG: hypothetical protein UX10_C0008G0028, partial [Candidatus Magasanikbacteria bacterium GW2011_GWA2_45_39]
ADIAKLPERNNASMDSLNKSLRARSFSMPNAAASAATSAVRMTLVPKRKLNATPASVT